MTEKKNPVCCICGCECENEWGNNPWPIVKDAESRCCDQCDATVVIPARIQQFVDAKRKENLKTERISMRLSTGDLRMLDEICTKTGRSRGNLLTALIRTAYSQIVEDKQ